jgi:hypothetical protein
MEAADVLALTASLEARSAYYGPSFFKAQRLAFLLL